MQDLTIGVLLVVYVNFWMLWLAHIVYMLEVTEESHTIQQSCGATKHT